MKIETFEMRAYDFVLDVTRLYAGPAARHIVLGRWLEGTEEERIVLTGPVPKWLREKIEGRCKPRRQRAAEPMPEYQCASGSTLAGVRLLWETGRKGQERQYLIDLPQLAALCRLSAGALR